MMFSDELYYKVTRQLIGGLNGAQLPTKIIATSIELEPGPN